MNPGRASIAPGRKPSLAPGSNLRHSVAPSGFGAPRQSMAGVGMGQPQQPQQPRNTLGGVSRISTAPPKKSISAAASSSMPKSSTATGKSDSRNINDKQFQAQCQNQVHNFLLTNNYPLKPVLKMPTSKDFLSMFEFLAVMIKPGFKYSAKPDDDIIAFFKMFKYPVQISKRHLLSSGSSQSWPNLLAALAWMVELIEFSIKYEAIEQEKEDEFSKVENKSGEDEEGEFFSFLVNQSYIGFMNGEEGAYVDSVFEEKYAEKNRAAEQDIEDSLEKQRKFELEIEELENFSNAQEIEELNKKIEVGSKDIEKYLHYVKQLKNAKAKHERRRQTIESDMKTNAEALDEQVKRKQYLQEIITEQQKKSLDAKKINHDLEQLRDEFSKVQSECNRLDRTKSDNVKKIQSLIAHIEEQIQTYGEQCRRLSLVDPMGNIDTKYAIEFHAGPLYDGSVASIDPATPANLKIVKKNLKALLEEINHKNTQMNEQTKLKNHQIQSIEDEIKDKEYKVKISTLKFNNVDNNLKSENEKQKKELELLANKVGEAQEMNKRIKQDSLSGLEHSNSEITTKTQENAKLKIRLKQNQDELRAIVITSLNDFTSHKIDCQNNLQQLIEHITLARDERKSAHEQQIAMENYQHLVSSKLILPNHIINNNNNNNASTLVNNNNNNIVNNNNPTTTNSPTSL
ncbi:hypothetical protein CYY_005629 [Polysphondylium violaceum]|uniref:Kinetochore protein NDC80 n=1 Tax=Polysphondylium violaceum TaxID=133409 RepID=A0A8J4Q2P0_9MYCE|nr:hypothetical protein CYY_005629 [Polysphondylium violaceum]